MTLRNKIILIMLLVLSLVLTAFLFIIHTWKSSLRDGLEGQAIALLSQKSRIISDEILNGRRMLRIMAQDEHLRGSGIDAIRSRLHQWSDENMQFESFYYDTMAGDVYPPDGAPFSVRDREYFPGILAGDEITGTPIISRHTGRIVLLLTVPVKNTGGRLKGALAGTLIIKDIIASATSGDLLDNGARIFLFDVSGRLLGSTDSGVETGLKVVTAEEFPDVYPLWAALSDAEKNNPRDVHKTEVHLNDGKSLLHFISVPGLNWSLVHVQPVNRLMAPADKASSVSFFIIAMLLLFSAAVFFVFEKMIISPVERLRDAHLKLESGDLSARVEENWKGEFSDLARAFNRSVISLELSDRKFRTIFETFPYPIVLNRLSDGVYIDINSAAEKFLGFRESKLIGRSSTGIINEIAPEYSQNAREKLFSEGRLDNEELKLIRPDGNEHWIIYSTRIIKIAEEEISLTVLADITDLKKTEEALRVSERKIRAILDQSFQFMGLLTIDGILIEVNRSAIELIGFPDSEVLNRPFWDTPWWAHSPEVRDMLRESIRRAASGETVRFETTNQASDGRLLNVDFSIKPVFDENGTIIFLIPEGHDITDRKMAEEKLKGSEENYRLLFQHNPAPMLIYENGTLKLLAVNDAFENHYGYTQEEIHQMRLTDLYPEEEKGPITELASDLVRQGHAYAGEWHHLKRDGTLINIEARSHNITFEGRTGRIAVIMDITERKRAETALHESSNLLQAVLDTIPVRVFWKDLNLKYLGCNKPFALDAGKDNPVDLIGMEDYQMPWCKQAEFYRRDDLEVLSTGKAKLGFEELQTTHNGLDIWLLTSKIPLLDAKNRIHGILGIYEDITNRKLSEVALRESEAKFRTIVESSPVGYHIYKIDDAGRLVFSMYNQAADLILHASHEPFIGLEICEAFPALSGTGIPEMYASVARGEIGMQNFEAPYNYNDIQGTYEVRVFRGAPGQVVVNFVDITDRKLAEERQAKLTEQLHQSQKMDAIGQLAGGVAHDFNNLLTGIMGSAQLLQIAENLSEKQKKYVSLILSAAERAGSLTKKLLTFSRSGNKASTAVDCVKIIKDTVEILQHTIDKSITITVENRAEQTTIIGDDSMLMNALMNMGINASHAMLYGGVLSYALENIYFDEIYSKASPFEIRPGKYIDISVIDTGCGMEPEVVSRIFEPFFTTKDHGKGTGLGLSMVYGTVQEHGGAINVYSEPGNGTVFHIYLPVAEGSVSYKINAETLPGGTATVLLIDDEELIRITAKGFLESLGYKVLVETNGEDGIKTFTERSGQIDLVILDMIMPVMGGREAFVKLREFDPEIPILIASGFAKEEHMVLLKEQGVSGFLQKPFRISELALKVHEALEK